jgi:hypothetical protein
LSHVGNSGTQGCNNKPLTHVGNLWGVGRLVIIFAEFHQTTGNITKSDERAYAAKALAEDYNPETTNLNPKYPNSVVHHSYIG